MEIFPNNFLAEEREDEEKNKETPSLPEDGELFSEIALEDDLEIKEGLDDLPI